MVEDVVSRGLEARLVLDQGGFHLDVSLSIAPRTTVALLGPNGAGKSTTVAALAGLLPLNGGTIVLGDRVLDDPESGVFVHSESRRIGVVFQDYLLFPHMTVAQNIAFGVGQPSDRRVAEWIDRLDLAAIAHSKPRELSGGQAQRVALARALVTQPDLLLLDEPLAALDVTTRTRLRRTLAEHLDAFEGPRLLITHDPSEAFLLADEISVIERGTIIQQGTADDIRLRPRTAYVADLAGSNLFTGEATGGAVSIGSHTLHIADTAVSGPVLVTIHPRVVSLHTRRPEGSPRNAWETKIVLIEPLGDRVRLNVGAPLPLTVEVTSDAVRSLGLAPGSGAWVSIKATEIGVQEG
jgi:molybdate transport system ATP-binding protein